MCLVHDKVHEYISFDIDWGSVPGTIIVSMIKCLHQIIEDFPEVLRGTKPSPAGDHLFTVRDEEDRKVLPEEQAWQVYRPQHNSYSCARGPGWI